MSYCDASGDIGDSSGERDSLVAMIANISLSEEETQASMQPRQCSLFEALRL